ncbi:hypothetical protein BH11MYX3_BH11MYX3_34140 [soil metagenome]
MGESGRTCKPVDKRGKLADEPPPRASSPRRTLVEREAFDVQCTRDKVLIKFRGRIVRTITGSDADEIRAAVASGDDAAVQLLVARKTGNFKRGNER